jgi:creatinine amidohydrolase
MLSLDPGCVRLDRVEPGATAPLADLIGDLRTGGVAAVAPNGVLGDPTGASADDGAAVFEALTTDLLAAVDQAFPR